MKSPLKNATSSVQCVGESKLGAFVQTDGVVVVARPMRRTFSLKYRRHILRETAVYLRLGLSQGPAAAPQDECSQVFRFGCMFLPKGLEGGDGAIVQPDTRGVLLIAGWRLLAIMRASCGYSGRR